MLYAACENSVGPPPRLTTTSRPPTSEIGDRLLPTLKELQREVGEQMSGRYAHGYLNGLAVFVQLAGSPTLIGEALVEWRDLAITAAAASISTQEENIDRLGRLLDLDPDEKTLLHFQMNRRAPAFRSLFDALLDPRESPLFAELLLGAMLEIDAERLRAILANDAPLVRNRLITVRERPFHIEPPSPYLSAVLTPRADSDIELCGRFARPLAAKPSTASLARLDQRDEEIVLRLLSTDVPDGGTHLLLYNTIPLDNLDLVARLLDRAGFDAYTLETSGVPSSDLAVWAIIAQRFIREHHSDAVLVIDKAEHVLGPRKLSFMSIFGLEEADSEVENDERHADEDLLSADLRCIWLSERAQRLTERSIGRFLLHCEVRPGSRAERRERVAAVFDEYELSERLQSELSRYSLLAEQQVRQAARLSELVAPAGDERERVIARAVQGSQRILRRDSRESLRESVTSYSLENLNVAGRFTPEQIIRSLKERPYGTLIFFGLPGSGKTTLAEHIAIELDLPLVTKRASDLLSKWLGESEQNIASMFREAAAEGALLFLDEADSFLRDRALARAEWSVTQVNEMLQHMERYDGIFIAATNLFRELDQASLRRFTWKLEFLALRSEQSWRMFCIESGHREGEDAELDESLRERLAGIENLTAGDFATVKRQSLMLGESLGADEWIEQLSIEAKLKLAGIERNRIGFRPD